jgi:AraC-like DNA-binding protein
MKFQKKLLPIEFSRKINQLTPQTTSLSFYIKECGYCSERKLTFGIANDYNDILVVYSLSGVVCFIKNQTTQYIHPDNVIASACNTPLTFTRAGKNWICFYMVIGGSQAKKYYNFFRTAHSVFPVNPLSPLLDFFIEGISLDFNQSIYTDMKASLIVHNLLFELYNASYNISLAKSITPVQETTVNQAIKYIRDNYSKDLSIDSISSEMNFSKYYFCKLFKKHTGTTVHQYVNEYRVHKSKELLTYSKLSINGVAISVGFKNTLTFSRAFKSFMHMTPSEYRKNF